MPESKRWQSVIRLKDRNCGERPRRAAHAKVRTGCVTCKYVSSFSIPRSPTDFLEGNAASNVMKGGPDAMPAQSLELVAKAIFIFQPVF